MDPAPDHMRRADLLVIALSLLVGALVSWPAASVRSTDLAWPLLP